jgi:crotonobetainyl-CoA:carnitine CoA-transferase CaiB-like acyl-CoA transferase
MSQLESSGLPFAPIARPENLLDDPHLNASGGLLETTLPDGQTVRLPAMPFELDGKKLGARLNPPKSGEHTVEILRDAGYSDEDIETLIESGAASYGE